MRIRNFGLIAALAFAFVAPAGAQTMQTSPQTSNGLSVPSTGPAPKAAVATPPPATKTDATRSSAAKPAGLLDINTASEADLDALPGVGRTRAAAIIKNRPYNGKDDLVNKKIIPAHVYNGIKNKIIAKQG